MKKENVSYNTGRLTVMTREFLIPSWPKILLDLLIGALLLMLWNARVLWDSFSSGLLIQNSGDSKGLASGQVSWLERNFDNLFGGRLAQILFWAFAGCAIYVCIWFGINVINNLRNDIVADEYVHPRTYSRTGYWESVLARKSFLTAVIVTLIGFFVMSIRFLPSLARLFYTSLQGFSLSPGLGEITGAILASGFMIYVFILLIHIVINCWRSVYTDL